MATFSDDFVRQDRPSPYDMRVNRFAEGVQGSGSFSAMEARALRAAAQPIDSEATP